MNPPISTINTINDKYSVGGCLIMRAAFCIMSGEEAENAYREIIKIGQNLEQSS